MSAKTPKSPGRKLFTIIVITAVIAAGVSLATVALLVSIFEHKQEARNPFYRVVELDDDTVDPEIWGKNFPLQFDSYKKTVDMVRTRHGGSEAVIHEPTETDPRTEVSQSKIEADPRMKRMWAGYSFSADFREERGHAYMLVDQTYTGRQQAAPQPGTCINCHASTYTAYKELGDGDIMEGFAKINQMSYAEAREHVDHPVSCLDCHDPDTMHLRVTRPAFIEGIRLVKAAEGLDDYDVNRDASRQEMRTYACAQCHVEYYFAGDEKRLTFPWHNGRKADEILEYYEEIGFKDWTHKETGAPMLKAQHPEFEMWSQGIHSKAGVSCADCHMPYMRVGAQKVSDHHVRSPLLNINNACQTCHRESESEMLDRAETIQARHIEMRDMALDALVELIDGIKKAQDAGATQDELADALNYQRKASFLLDFAEAENSAGFHADQEAARVLSKSMDFSRRGWMTLADWWEGQRTETDTIAEVIPAD
ncbi:ammonia-forming cytochrome c nitrite reductase subunit c552 [bacterium]|nr:ammonia-forming cytochrome c nitrite reductase subunit c552 [bacterium]